MNIRTIKVCLAGLMFAACQQTAAEDIDLFMGFTPPSTDLPNVMIVMDNAANFSSNSAGSTCIIDGVATALSGTVGGIEQCALYKVINELEIPVDDDGNEVPKLNIGMMVYNANNIRDIDNLNCGGTVGGCLVLPLRTLNSTNKSAILAWIKSWRTSGGAGDGYIKANSEAIGATMQETWAYFAGRTGLSGRNYNSIKPTSNCASNYVIFVGNSYTSSGTPGDATGNTGPKKALEGTNSTTLMNAFPAATTDQKEIYIKSIPTTCNSNASYTFVTANHENRGQYADEWARYMFSQNITTYTIGVLGASCQPEYAALLTTMADLGEGLYYPTTNYDGLVIAFNQIFSQIQAKNSVFASVSLPASVGTQGTYLNQIYIGMFRPDKNARPRWLGNLKQYKLGFVNNELKLVYDLADNDTNNTNDQAAINSGTGFITPCARSYWTDPTVDSYWSNKPQGDCLSISGSSATAAELKASNYPDGPIVEKGAQAFKLRLPEMLTTRTVKTCSVAFNSCTSLFDFNNTNISAATLGAASDTIRDNLINWARGMDVQDSQEDIDGVTNEMRQSVHGDVIHSRPVAINYGTEAEPQVVVYYSGNDGMLRAINGNRTGDNGTVTPGKEFWSFIPPEFYDGSSSTSKLQRIYSNTVAVTFPGPGANPKPYGIDGPLAAYKGTIGGESKTFLYASMRRGGKAIYGFDVSTPSSPSLKWKIGCSNDGATCSTGLSDIGQTWATPSVVTASGYGGGASPLLIFGGGYDTCEDTDTVTSSGTGSVAKNHDCATSTRGDHVYVVDADTGTFLKRLDTDRSVIAGITVVTDSNGRAQYGYTADLGGNVYRITMGNLTPANWTITKIASLGCSTVTTCTANRKFMFAPDVVNVNGVYYLLLGSGDREKPLTDDYYPATNTVQNYFFLVQDKPSASDWLTDENERCSADVLCLASLTAIPANGDPTQDALDEKKGWYLAMRQTTGTDPENEQVVTSAITVSNVVTFSTHIPATPDTASCTTNLGKAYVYNVNLFNAANENNSLDGSRYERISGDGLPPSPVAGEVRLDDGSIVPFIIGADKDSPLEGGSPTGTASWSQPKSRVYWYIEQK